MLLLGVFIPFLMSAYCVFSIVYLFPEMAQAMHVSIGILTFAVTLSFIGGAIGGVVLGMVADAYGRRMGLGISIVLFSLMTLITGFVRTPWELYITWFLVGFGVNPENGITYAVIAENWRGGRGLIGGFTQGLYFIGLMLDALVYGLIRTWNLVLIVVGASSLVLSIPWLAIIPETASRVGITRVGYGEIFRGKFLLITVLGTLVVASAFLFTVPLVSIAPTYLEQLRIANLGLWLLALPAIGAIAYTLAGYLSDVYGRARVLIALSVIALLSSALLIVVSTLRLINYLVIPIALSYFSSSIFSYLGVFLSELYPARVRATASNFVFLLGRVLGGVGPPLIALAFAENLGFGLGLVMIICAAVSLTSALILGIKLRIR